MQLIRRFNEFWPHYVDQHGRPLNRRLHFAGTTLGLLCLAGAGLFGKAWLLPAGLVAAYGAAWIGHVFVEHNRPATFRHPVLSLFGDLRMYGLMWAGQMEEEVERLAAGDQSKITPFLSRKQP